MTRWFLLAAFTVGVSVLLDLIDVDAAPLFAGLLVAALLAIVGYAPRPRTPAETSTQTATAPHPDSATEPADKATKPDATDPPMVPRAAMLAAQGTVGVYIGTMADPTTISGLGSAWLPVLVVGLGTLALSVAGGALLGLHREGDALTGSLALVAGGASGLVALTRDLGGDERVVAVVQYVRVALVTSTIPLVASLVFHASSSNVVVARPTWTEQAAGVALLAICIGVGLPLGKLIHLPAAGLLGPMALATAAELTGIAGDAAVPSVLLAVAYAVIGWQAGLGFTLPQLRAIGRILPAAVVLILAIGVGCALLGVLLSWWTGESMFDCYLATTPGGIYAVLAAATAAGSNVAFVVAAQILRVLLMLFVAPFAARAAARRLAP
ncbi:membrane protein AbrB duplication [Mycobacteroides abscessus subsp. abscessus]|uniref:AbrB family transcriptional regulator n=1 Tax=Gordonia jacobaea TaxID=122202 RepID=UPI0009CF06EF|nr:AbrB family transcriptional regulator [Gordonia jacobaea]SKX56528.1 membrane protein AbrB duplication [Mycobacteroides abscessus subsp. abscessus]